MKMKEFIEKFIFDLRERIALTMKLPHDKENSKEVAIGTAISYISGNFNKFLNDDKVITHDHVIMLPLIFTAMEEGIRIFYTVDKIENSENHLLSLGMNVEFNLDKVMGGNDDTSSSVRH